MGRHILVLGLGFVGLAAFAVFAGWAFFIPSTATRGGWSLGPVWPYLLGGALVLGALAAFLSWLASYTAKHRYDERPDQNASLGLDRGAAHLADEE